MSDAYDYGVLLALRYAGLSKEAFESVNQMKDTVYRGQRLQQQGLPANLPSQTKGPVQTAKPKVAPKPAPQPAPKPVPQPKPQPVTTSKPPAQNLMTKAPSAIQRRNRILRQLR